ncbi:MAG: phage tail protein [Solobacterium sp.]|nr:phage tail protein [Solobacterium sp.]
MAITKKHVPLKETIGDQYVCFDVPDATTGEWTTTYETEVVEIDGVKTSEITDNTSSTDVYGSGKLHDTVRGKGSYDISVTTLGFDAATLAKMRGDDVDEGGLIRKGTGKRPYFAYGRVVAYTDGGIRYDWYPKCKLIENSDSTNTSEETYSEQTDDLTIRAYEYDGDKNIVASVDTSIQTVEGLTEAKFFSKPILTPADLASVLSGE